MRTESAELRILIAEDSLGDVLLVEEALAAYGLSAELQVCENGEAALSALAHCDGSNLPDLVIVDLNLPRVDGMDVLRYIRGLPVFDRTPVMIFTSSHGANDRAEAERFGANAYVTKPPTLDDFLLTVGSAIHKLIGRSGSHQNDSVGTLHGWSGKRPTALAHLHFRLRTRNVPYLKSHSRSRALLLRSPRRPIRVTVRIGIHTCEFCAEKENLG
jgi:two-component system, chemotaxis family, response regulator Rcp1